MAPVDELIERPLGRLGETVNVTGEVPPVDVTGVELEAAIPAVSVSDAIASVVVRAAETASAKVFELVAPLASVAVTV
jgi:cell division ATPase FtsA